MWRFKFLLLLVTVGLLTACGGSGGDDVQLNDPPVLVNAGDDYIIDEQNAGTLTGDAQGVGAINYAWTSSAAIEITHSDTSLPAASFTAPVVTSVTEITFTLTATDENGTTGRDTVIVTVQPINELPVPVISVTHAEQYPANSFPVNYLVQLSAAQSNDPDPQPGQADIIAYKWQQTAGPRVIGGDNSQIPLDQASLSFTTPILRDPDDVVIELTVTDQDEAEVSTQVTLRLLGESGTLPSMTFAPMPEVMAGELIRLEGFPASEAPNAAPYQARWSNISNVAVTIGDRTSFNAYALAPDVATSTELRFLLSTTDSFGSTATAEHRALVHPKTFTQLNDTGVTQFADGQSISSQYIAAYAGQDAEYGYDRTAISGVADKAGSGDKGFDFNKLNTNGNEIDNVNAPSPCVRDNITGLVWEVKNSDPSSLHYADNKYTWYFTEENGNFEGAQNLNSNQCNLSSGTCNTSELIAQVNQTGLCGFYDWRLPTHKELQSIMHLGKVAPPLIESNYFPTLSENNDNEVWYWTRQSSADGAVDEIARNAWALDFRSGLDSFINKQQAHRVILVRAGR